MQRLKRRYDAIVENASKFIRWIQSPYLRRKTFEAPRDNFIFGFFRELSQKGPLIGTPHTPFRIRQRIDKIWKG